MTLLFLINHDPQLNDLNFFPLFEYEHIELLIRVFQLGVYFEGNIKTTRNEGTKR